MVFYIEYIKETNHNVIFILKKGGGSLGKKCSLSVAACDITIDMASAGNGNGRSGSAATIDSNVLPKKSPMHKGFARLARLAGTSIGRDAMNSSGLLIHEGHFS